MRTEIADLFKQITPKIIELVNQNFEKTTISNSKTVESDYATQTDIDSENLIVDLIKHKFPDDQIMAEEGYSDGQFDFSKRTWVIDPICGTNNLMRGVRFFCSNIAVVENNQLIAACVVDHSKGTFIWSVGDQQVFVNEQIYSANKKDKSLKIDVDFGSVFKLGDAAKKKYAQFIEKVVMEKNLLAVSMTSSLGFAYTALGINDGFYCAQPKLWDVAAAVFLIRQNGGVVTDSLGREWNLNSVDAVGGVDQPSHQKLLSLLQ